MAQSRGNEAPCNEGPNTERSDDGMSARPAGTSAKTRRSPRTYVNRKGRLRREDLYYAMDLLLGEVGWDGLTIRALADWAGVSVGLVHHHFAGRAEMARSLYDNAVQAIALRASGAKPAPFAQIFREVMVVSMYEATRIGDAWSLAFAHAMASGRPLPGLGLSFIKMLERATDIPPDRPDAVCWHVETAHRALLERYLVMRNEERVLASAEICSAQIVRFAQGSGGDEAVARLWHETRRHLAQHAGTDWHREDCAQIRTSGLPRAKHRKKPRSQTARGE